MGSEISKAKRPSPTLSKTKQVPITPTPPQETAHEILDHLGADSDSGSLKSCSFEAKRGVTLRLPQETIDEILDHLGADSDSRSLKSCALVSKSWVPSSRRHLFRTALFTTASIRGWVRAFPVPEESPAHHVRYLCFSIEGYHRALEEFTEHTPSFTNAESLTLFEFGISQPLRRPSPWRLPQSVTSLFVSADAVTLVRLQEIMAQLPNLDNLSLSGFLPVVDRKTLPGIGTVPMGRFGGKLRLVNGYTDDDVVDMLLGTPTGLHFTDIQICSARKCLLPTVRLAEACSETLVKLSHMTSFHCKYHPF